MQQSIKIIHTADLHLGAEFSFLDETKRKQRKSELRLTMEKIFNICKTNSIDFLLLAGDVFDSNSPDTAEIQSFFTGIAGIPETIVIVASGNHDPLTVDSPYLSNALPANLHIIGHGEEKISFEDKNCVIYGSAFTGCYKEPQRLFTSNVDEDKINIAVIHGDTQMSSRYNYVSREFLENSGMNYVALGHIHTHTDVMKIGKTYYAYSGCPEPHGFDECGEMGIIAGNISSEKSEFQFLPISRRRFETVKVDVTSLETNSDIAEKIEKTLLLLYGENFAENLYKILLIGETDAKMHIDTSEIVSRLAEKVFYIKVKNNTEIKIDTEILSREKSLKGEFVRVMLEQINASPEKEKELGEALKIGLKAFGGEVKFDEDK